MRNLSLIALMVVSLSAIAEAPSAPAGPTANLQEPARAPGQGPAPGPPSPGPPSPPSEPSRIPEYAIPSLGLETSVAWKEVHDEQTKGSSTGQTNYPVFPDGRNGVPGRQFVTWYGDKGGQRYHLTFGR